MSTCINYLLHAVKEHRPNSYRFTNSATVELNSNNKRGGWVGADKLSIKL
jgi:hypothetical protein